MEQIPVNSIDNNSNTIRVNDTNTPIKLTFKYVDGSIINLKDKIDYFYLTKDDENFYSVTDITFEGNELIFKLPNLIKGLYRVEIRDIEGSIYPADDSLFILLKHSFEEGKESYYTSYREDILNNVEPIIIQHIEKNPDKFRGERGQQGFPGRDGLPGIDGKDGKDGIDGEKGDPGKDGSMSFVDLTPEEKEQLRGEIGLPGQDGKDGIDGLPGKDGDITNQGIGTKNLIDITTLTPRNGTYTFDLESGRINYSNIEWYLSQYIKLTGGKHSFRVQDYLINPNYGIGKMILHILDSENNIVVNNVTVEKGTPISIDLTGRGEQTYWIQLRVSNTESFGGFIEKPMLVEGDVPVLWDHKEVLQKDVITLKVPEDHETLQSAFDNAVYKYHNTPVNITMSRGFKPKSGITMSNIDASHITIKSLDPILEVDTTFTGDFLSGSYSKLPTLDCLIDMMDLGGNGVTCEKGSSGKINYNKGIKNAGGRGLYLSENSHMYARASIITGCNDRNVWVTRTSTFEGEIGDFSSNKGGENAVYISRDSNANLLQAKINNAFKNGLAVIRSFVNAESVDVSNAGETGIVIQRGSHVISEFLTANQCGINGVRVEHGSWISGREMTVSNSGSEGILIIHGSGGSIYGSTSNLNQSDGLKLTYGSQVNASGGNFSNNTGKDISLSHGSTVQIFGVSSVFSLSNSTPNIKNTLSENGILYSDL